MKVMRLIALTLILLFTITLSGCSSKGSSRYSRYNYGVETPPDVYYVKFGDTLFSIAWRFGLDQELIQQQNGITDPNVIFVGQRLQLQAGKAASAKAAANQTVTVSEPIITNKGEGRWVWPMKGNLVRRFNPHQIGANGIRIAGKPNQTVNAAEGGVVVYKGNGLNGYGNVVIIKHHDGVLSAYGFLSKTYVRQGQNIKKRQKIGTVGYATNNQLLLHFEVRKNGQPVNPLNYIGQKYHF